MSYYLQVEYMKQNIKRSMEITDFTISIYFVQKFNLEYYRIPNINIVIR